MDQSPPAPPTDLNLHDTIRLSAEGLAKVLGDLEARVVQTVWSLGVPATARAVHGRVIEGHGVALLTVVTVLNKLVDKGILRRLKREGVFHYEACLTQDEFRSRVSRRVVEGILSFGPAALASSFVDVLAERDPDQLEALRRLIEARQRGDEG